MQFIGPPFTFGINLINEGVGLVGPKAAVTAPQGVYWMSYNNFYVYNGSVQHLPCSVHNYVFNDINLTQSFKIHAFTIADKNEVGWFYCSASSSEIDRYVIYNYAENIWFYGQLVRTAWLDAGIENYPRAVGNSYLFQQEKGFNDDGSPMTNVFNRLVRILEINLGAVDLDNVRQISDAEKNTLQFNAGSIIWNTTVGVLQVYTGNEWVDIGERFLPKGFEMASDVGSVSVKTNGDITIEL
jgi:hypothetical protein